MLKASQNFIDYQGTGISVLEMSHRSAEFQELANKLHSQFREVMEIPDNFHVLMTQGGASQQFSAVPLNLTSQGDTVNFLISGKWSQAAATEASKFNEVKVVNEPDALLSPESWKIDKDAKFFSFCQNESIDGVSFDQER